MATSRPRHMITETNDIAAVLDEAAARWPDSAGNRPELIRRILLEQLPHVIEQRAERIEGRRQRIRDGAGVLSGVWPVTWRDELRSDWLE